MQQASSVEDPVGLYLSIPFCRSKCTFCNFASGVYPASDIPRYVARLAADLRHARARAQALALVVPQQVDSVYFGGGTPSILTPGQLLACFRAIRDCFTILPDAEITIEAAPGFLADEVLEAAAEAGVNRISFGVQTFIDAEAHATGRLHAAAQALADLARVQRAGMSVSADLIAGLPGQNRATWQHSLETLIEAAPEHASIYMLEVDDDSRLGGEMLLGGTRYGAGLTPSDDLVADFYAEACETLSTHGLAQYEISNFARPGHQSRHNLRYWQRRPYLGLGLDASSMLRTVTGQPVRFTTPDDLETYLTDPSNPVTDLHTLDQAEELEEAWFLGLRRNQGVSLDALRAEFSPFAVDAFLPVLKELASIGLLQFADHQVALTARGRLLSNEVFTRFLDRPEEAQISSEAAVSR
jgi:oxygen-independent coproporphyrinogen-3 oxidase